MTLDLSDDMDIFDYLQSGTYYTRGDGDTFTAHSSVTVLRRAINSDNVSTGPGKVQNDTTTWHGKVKDFVALSVTPKFRDRIKDTSNVYWQVVSISYQTLGTRYRFQCQRVKNP